MYRCGKYVYSVAAASVYIISRVPAADNLPIGNTNRWEKTHVNP